MTTFSDYIIYVDESGDHSLAVVDATYPIFVLAFCIMRKESYINHIVPAVKKFKFDIFGHDDVILHEHEIRKSQNDFSILLNAEKRRLFYDGINHLMRSADFTVVAAAINKTSLTRRYSSPDNPYNLGLGFCMERAAQFLVEKGQAGKLTYIIAESRGKNENDDLELEFRRMTDGLQIGSRLTYNLRDCPYDIRFTKKQANMAGLQLADMVARPIGRYVLDRNQPNQAMDIIKTKIFGTQNGVCSELGLKVFPGYP